MLEPHSLIEPGGARSAIYGPGKEFVALPHTGAEEQLVVG